MPDDVRTVADPVAAEPTLAAVLAAVLATQAAILAELRALRRPVDRRLAADDADAKLEVMLGAIYAAVAGNVVAG